MLAFLNGKLELRSLDFHSPCWLQCCDSECRSACFKSAQQDQTLAAKTAEQIH